MVSNAHVSDICMSDHCPIICAWSCKPPKKLAKGHTCVHYRSFKYFNNDEFLRDLSFAPFVTVFGAADTTTALITWYDAFLPVTEKHAPLRRERIKHPTLPQWLSTDIIKAMKTRDELKKTRSLMTIKDTETKSQT